MNKFICLLIVYLFCSNCYAALPDTDGAIGQFHIKDNPDLIHQKLISNYGKGKFVSPFNTTDKGYCYFNKEGKYWSEIVFYQLEGKKLGFSGIFISSIPLCEKTYRPKKAFQTFRTPRNIGINASKASVLKAYGQPQRDMKTDLYKIDCNKKEDSFLCPKYGKEVLIYNGSTWSISFHFTNNKLVSILLGPLD